MTLHLTKKRTFALLLVFCFALSTGPAVFAGSWYYQFTDLSDYRGAATEQSENELQIELLQKLADEDVEEAKKELSKRAVIMARRGFGSAWDGFREDLALGAIAGDHRAMRQLAYVTGLSKPNARLQQEGLNLLLNAVIFGSPDAPAEISKLESMGLADINVLLQFTLTRLNEGVLYDCVGLILVCHNITEKQWFLQKADKLQQPDAPLQLRKTFFNMARPTLAVTEAELQKFVAGINQFNDKSGIVAHRLTDDELEWAEQQKLSRQIAKAETAKKQSNFQVRRFWEEQEELVVQFASRLNQHRAENQPVTNRELSQILLGGPL